MRGHGAGDKPGRREDESEDRHRAARGCRRFDARITAIDAWNAEVRRIIELYKKGAFPRRIVRADGPVTRLASVPRLAGYP